jgi:plasmid maintenance system antidote protein VapI
VIKIRESSELGENRQLWAGMQLQYDLYQAGKLKRPKIERLVA